MSECVSFLCPYVLLTPNHRNQHHNAQYALTETCLALTMFREEIGVSISVMFLALICMKALHWACELRVQSIRQQEENQQMSSNAGLMLLLLCLFSVDVLLVSACLDDLRSHGPSVKILFGFEAAIGALGAFGTVCKFIVHAYDARLGEVVWHNKGNYVFGVEFTVECIRFFFYIVFFTIVFTYYGMPFNVCRDLWVSYSNLKAKLDAFTRYRKLTRNMNERFLDATEEELIACDRVCIICRDEMAVGEAKKLNCGHIFHFYCLRQWLQQQQNCPTCRTEISTDAPLPVREPPEPAPAADPDPPPAAGVGENEQRQPVANEQGEDEVHPAPARAPTTTPTPTPTPNPTPAPAPATTSPPVTISAPPTTPTTKPSIIPNPGTAPATPQNSFMPTYQQHQQMQQQQQFLQPMMSPMLFPSPMLNSIFQTPQASQSLTPSLPSMCKVVVESAHVRSKPTENSISLRLLSKSVSIVAIDKIDDFYQIPDGFVRVSDVVLLNLPLDRFLSPSFLNSSPIRQMEEGDRDKNEIVKLKEEIAELREKFANLEAGLKG